MKTQSDFKACSERLKALADPTRLHLVQRLFQGESSVSALCELVNADISAVSHHLKILRFAKIVTTERRGREIFYTLNPEILASKKDSDAILNFGCCKFDLST